MRTTTAWDKTYRFPNIFSECFENQTQTGRSSGLFNFYQPSQQAVACQWYSSIKAFY
jgi:hypothetical protein